MSKIIDKLIEQVDRRTALGMAVKAASALALAIVGVPKLQAQAELVPYKCCNLCATSSSTCTGECIWSWPCCYDKVHFGAAGDNHNYACNEIYDPCVYPGCPHPTTTTCLPTPGWKCSRAVLKGVCAR